MLEREIEKRLVTAVRKNGGMCPKLTSPGTAGMPDRLIILPGGHIAFAELKAPGQKPRRIQQVRHQQLQDLGCTVHTIDHPNQIPEVIREIRSA